MIIFVFGTHIGKNYPLIFILICITGRMAVPTIVDLEALHFEILERVS